MSKRKQLRDSKGRFVSSKAPQEIAYEYELPHTGGLEAKLKIVRIGQEEASVGDMVVVKSTTYLPKQDDCPHIERAIQFGERLKFGPSYLVHYWGSVDGDWRVINRYFNSKTWKEAFNEARKCWNDEIQKLILMLEKRHKALMEAEK